MACVLSIRRQRFVSKLFPSIAFSATALTSEMLNAGKKNSENCRHAFLTYLTRA